MLPAHAILQPRFLLGAFCERHRHRAQKPGALQPYNTLQTVLQASGTAEPSMEGFQHSLRSCCFFPPSALTSPSLCCLFLLVQAFVMRHRHSTPKSWRLQPARTALGASEMGEAFFGGSPAFSAVSPLLCLPQCPPEFLKLAHSPLRPSFSLWGPSAEDT